MPRAKAVLKWLGFGLGGLLAVVAGGVGVGYAWLQSDGGREWLVGQIEAAASTPGELELSIGRLEGDLPARVAVRDVMVSDAEGRWLSIAALDLAWRPWQLLSGTLAIDSLALSNVDLARLPSAAAAEAGEYSAETAPTGLPALPFRIRISQLTADEIALGAAVLGQPARFTLAGEATRREDGGLVAGLTLSRLDGKEMQLVAKLDYDPAGDVLSAEVDAADAPGGLLAALLDMPNLPRAELRLAGSGPLSAWAGDFTLSLGQVARAAASIGLQRGPGGDLGFELDGHSDIEPPVAGTFWDLVRGRSELALEGTWQQAQRLRLERFAASNANLTLNAQGDFEPQSGAIDMTLGAAAEASAPLAAELGLARLDRLTAEVAVSGTTDRPQAMIELQADGIESPDFEAATATLNGRLVAENDLLGPAPKLGLDLNGRLDAPRLPGNDEVNEVLGSQLSLALKGSLDISAATIEVAALDASVDNASLAASGPFNLDDGSAQLRTTLTVADLAQLQPLTAIALGGRVQLAGPITVAQFGSRLQIDLQGRWEEPSSDIALIDLAAGDGMDLSTRLTLDGATVEIENVTARSKAAEVTAALTVTAESALRDGRYRLALPDAAVLAEELGADFSGPATVEGDIAGPFEALDLSGRLLAQQVDIEGQILRDLDGTYRLSLRGADIDGPLTLALSSPFGPVEARADLKMREDAVTLAALQAKLPETLVSGEVTLPLDGGAPIAVLDGEIADLGSWLAFAGLAGGGQGRIQVKLNAPGAAAPVLATADFAKLTLLTAPGAMPVAAARLSLDLQAQDPALEQPGSFKLRAEALSRDNLDLNRLDLDGAGTASRLDLTLSAAGTWVEPLELRAAATVSRTADSLGIDLTEAEGRAFGQPLRLRQAAQLTLAPAETRLENLDLSSGDTRLTADARIGGGQIAVVAALDQLPMTTVDGFWESGISGTMSAKLDLAGALADPRGTAELTATGLRPRDGGDVPALALTAAADWRAGRVKIEGQLGGDQVTAARFSAEAPLALTADGAGLEVPDDGPLSGAVDWAGDITTLLLFVPLPQHRLAGQAAVALDITGTVGAPRLEGSVALNDARYENLETGTILRDLDLAAEIAQDQVTLASLTANDSAGGRISGEGNLALDPEKQFPFDVSVALDKFHAVRRDDVTAVTGGTIRANGSLAAPRIEGRLTTETVEVSLAGALPPDVVSLDVIEIKDGVVQEQPEQLKKGPTVDVALDIIIEMPGRVFVRGRGLDSEWGGRLSVQGTSAEPLVSGEVKVVRGQLSVVGKPFKLKEGKVTLPKAAGSEPQLDVTAVNEGKDLIVTANLSGPPSKLDLELTSVPELPRDEIISRVLFGKSAASLSAAEAAQLALALNDLASGSDTDLLGLARRTVGVDVLRVQTTEEGAAAVEAGKYVTEDIYVGVEQGTTTESSTAEVEIELTPNITLESEVTGTGASKSGVRFQWDY